MIVRDEEPRLRTVIGSVQGLVDEICVVDTGSRDGTVQLARQLGARVEEHPWRDDFSEARNTAMAMAKGDWILQLDADEELTAEARRQLPELVQRKGVVGYIMPIDSIVPSGISRNYGMRLFRRVAGATYRGRIHEDIGPSLVRHGSAVAVEVPILHHGYKEDPMVATGKRSRNRHLLVKSLEESGENPWYRYYLAVEDLLSGEPQAALENLDKLSPFMWIEGQPTTLRVQAHMITGRWSEALETAREGTRTYPHVLTLWAQMAVLGYALGRTEVCRGALPVLRKPPEGSLGHREVAEATARYLEGCLTTSKEEAASYWRQDSAKYAPSMRSLLRHVARTGGLPALSQALQGDSSGKPPRYSLVLQALIDLQDWPAAIRLLEAMPPGSPPSEAGAVFWSQGHHDEALRIWRQAGGDGWLHYGVIAALYGESSDLVPALDHLLPLQVQALQDIQRGEATWRLAYMVPTLWDLGQPGVIETMIQRAPFLAEAVSGHYRLYIEP